MEKLKYLFWRKRRSKNISYVDKDFTCEFKSENVKVKVIVQQRVRSVSTKMSLVTLFFSWVRLQFR